MFSKSIKASQRILISGAGIAGLTLAKQLQESKIPFMIIDKRPQLATDGAGIALPANAVKALRWLGFGKQIDQQAHQVKQIIYTDAAGQVLSQASLLEKPLNTDHFLALQRHQLHDILSEGIKDQIHFDTSIEQLQQTEDGVLIKFTNPKLASEMFSCVVGADGLHSGVRQLAFSGKSLDDMGVSIWRWTCHYPNENLQPTYMLAAREIFMAYPIGKDEVYCYAHAFDPENLNAQTSDHQATLRKYFAAFGGVAQDLLKILPDNQSIIPGRLRSVPQPVFSSERVALVGDAGHACSPMLQQGAAGALEDVIALSELLKHFPVKAALAHYEKFRSERVNWITTSSDGPMKMLIHINEQILADIQQKIRENGPLNVQGWKKLLATDPLAELAAYIETNKNRNEEKLETLVATASI